MRWQAKRRHRAQESGFTLMEMLVVLVVIALIAAVAIPQIMGMLENAKTRAALGFEVVEGGIYPFKPIPSTS